MLDIILSALWFILPAYVANGAPVMLGGGTPIDLGRKFLDGKRILGDGKTFKGFFAGVLTGTFIGTLQGRLVLGFFLSIGALVGDMAGSFVKRRLNIKRGDSAPLLDQLDFILGAVLFSLIFARNYVATDIIVTALLITPVLHLLANRVTYKVGYKDVAH